MVTNLTVLLIFMTLTSVTSQTFQYSRGWTNGKRGGHRPDDVRVISRNLEKVFSPCQMSKLKYVLEGRPWDKKLSTLCELEDDDIQPKRFKSEHNTELYDAFQ